MVRIGHVMKRNVVSIQYGQAVSVAATLMRVRQIGSVLIKHDEEIVGIVTEADIVRKVVAKHRAPEYTPVESIMSSPIISIEEDSPLFEAASMMENREPATWQSPIMQASWGCYQHEICYTLWP